MKLLQMPDSTIFNEFNPQPTSVAHHPWAARIVMLSWAGGAMILFLGIVAHMLWQQSASTPPSLEASPFPVSLLATAEPSPMPIILTPESTPAPSILTPEPLLTPTVDIVSQPEPMPPNGVVFTLAPTSKDVGWTTSLDERSHFNVPNLHAGLYKGHIYHGVVRFDLSAIPPTANIIYAALELTGLDDQHVSQGGGWQVHLLDPTIESTWTELTHDMLHHATIEATLPATLSPTALAPHKSNIFSFAPEQLPTLRQHLDTGIAIFRLDGPTSGDDNLFSWDSGYRKKEELESKPTLRIVTLPFQE